MKMLNKGIIFLVSILIFSFVFVGAAFAQEPPEVEWKKTFGGSEMEFAYSVQQTTDGGYIIAGRTESYGAGKVDIYLIKTDANGNRLWDKTFGGSEMDYAYSVQQTNDGGYIIVGWTNSYGRDNGDVYLIKTDADGNRLWEKFFGGSKHDSGSFVQQTTDGGYIITGWTESSGAGKVDIYLIRTDANGNRLWDKTFGGSEMDYAYSVQQTNDGGYIIVGNTRSYSGKLDVYLIKTDANGNRLWDKTFGRNYADSGSSVQQTTDGGYIIAGWTHYGQLCLGSDAYLIKTDADGNKLWDKTFGRSYFDSGSSVQQTIDGGYIIAGETRPNGGYSDAYLIKTDANGNKLWEKTFGGSRGDTARFVQQTIDGGYIIVGNTLSYGAGKSDVYLIKLISWIEVNNTGSNLAIRQAPTTEENNVLKRVPDGWVLKLTNTHQNEESHDGYIWWEVEDVTDGIKGWSKYQRISDGTQYLEMGGEELKKRTDKLITEEDRKPVILQEVMDHHAEFLSDNFPPGLILAIVIKESGGNEFDNEIIAVNNPWEWGRGIMQIDNDKSVGARSKIRWYNSSGASAPDYCRGREGHGCTCDDGICYCEACKHYYTNTIQGIEANIKDGLGVLKDKSIWCTCCYNRSENAVLDEVEGLYKDKMGEEVIFYSKNEECRKYNSRIRYDSKIEKIKINNIEISCDDFKVIDTIWRYNSRSMYISGPNELECTKSDYLRCVADNLDKIQSTFGYGMPDKNKWNDSLRAVRNSDSIMVNLRSPGYLQACDSDGRMTGLANGEIIEGIPFSSYDAESGTIVIPFSYDSYRYKVVGTDSGTYGLDITSVEDGEATTFTATDIPTSPNAIHQYTIDWDALSQGEEGVTVQVDSDGDGTFEQTFTADDELSREEFLSATNGIPATIDFDPDTLNLQSEGKWVTTYIELPEGYDVSNINVSTIMLKDQVQAETKQTEIGDYDDDGIADLLVKFDRDAVQEILEVGYGVEIMITGELTGEPSFEGNDTIRVID